MTLTSISDLKKRVWMSRVLMYYGWDGHAMGQGDRKKVRCPFHDDQNPSATLDIIKQKFVCWAGCARGDILDLVQQREGITETREAINWIEQRF